MDTSSSVDHLPEAIIELILSKCPMKSVGRFKSVSKSWQSIISDPRFCRLHYIQQSKLPENQNMFSFLMKGLSDDSSTAYTLLYKILENGLIFERDYPRYDPSQGFSPLSSCDGLILLRNYDIEEDKCMLWNPLIGKHIIIPDFTPTSHPQAFTSRPQDKPFYHWLQHLYFDSTTNDYKILVAYQNWYVVYSCQIGIWSEIKDLPDGLDVCFKSICIDGCIYDVCNGEIICFDTRDGKLHKLPLPNDVEGFVLTDVSGRLYLKKWSDQYGRRLHLWVMEKNGSFEKSWKKLIISMEKEEPDLWYLSPVCLTNEDDVVLIARDTKDYYEELLYKYNPRQNSFQEIKFLGHGVYVDSCFSYSENLYMPPSNTPPCSSY